MIFQPPARPTKPPFSDIVDSEIPVLYRMAKTLTSDDSDAEDLVAQTLLLAAKAWDRFDGEYPRSWLIKILRNEFFGTVRKKANQPQVQLGSIAEPSDEGYWEDIDSKLALQDILTELKMLPDDYKAVLALCDIEELSYEEASIALEIPVGTVRSRLHRGRKLLRSRLVKFYKTESNAPRQSTRLM